jgi:hypothetical protein
MGEIIALFFDVGGVPAPDRWDRSADRVLSAMRNKFGGHSIRGEDG